MSTTVVSSSSSHGRSGPSRAVRALGRSTRAVVPDAARGRVRAAGPSGPSQRVGCSGRRHPRGPRRVLSGPSARARHGAGVTPLAAATASAPDPTGGLGGLSGLLAQVISAAGEPGVGLLTLLETVVPPVPSEVVLPLAGFLAHQGALALVWVLVASTAGSVAGAWVFYGLGAALGLDRSVRLLSRVPLLDREDLLRASEWFARHGLGSVFFGRLVPGVRSLVSLPAGAQRMSPLAFTLGTAAGSGVWNGLLVGAGYAVGSQWGTVGGWASTASNAVLGALAVAAVVLLALRAHRRRARSRT